MWCLLTAPLIWWRNRACSTTPNRYATPSHATARVEVASEAWPVARCDRGTAVVARSCRYQCRAGFGVVHRIPRTTEHRPTAGGCVAVVRRGRVRSRRIVAAQG